VLDNDTYTGSLDLSALLVDDAANGVLNLSTNGSFTYEPDTDFFGIETFTYKAITSATTSDVTTASITVTKEQALLHYTFDTDLTDSSGNGNDGGYADTNTAITNESIFGAGSLSLTGPEGSNYVAFSAFEFSTEDNWSLSFWYNAATTNTAGLVGDNLQNNTLTYNPDGGTNRSYYVRAGNFDDINTWTPSSNPTAIDTGVWHHLVVAATGTPAGSGDLTFYEDGVELFPPWDSVDDTAMIFDRVGHDGNSGGFGGYFNGLIDEVWIMNYALTSNEVINLRDSNDPAGGSAAQPATIVGTEVAPPNSLKMVVQLVTGSDASAYSPKAQTNLTDGVWDPVAHSDSAGGTYAVSNLNFSSTDGSNFVIYVKTTNTAEFFQIEAE
jgi:hypothetical protein